MRYTLLTKKNGTNVFERVIDCSDTHLYVSWL